MEAAAHLNNPKVVESAGDAQTPRQKYDARLDKEGLVAGDVRDGMERLFEMGFVEFDVNFALMKQYGHFGAAAEHIISHGTDFIV